MWNAFVYPAGVTSKAAVTSDGRTDSLHARSTVLTAECVKGAVIASRESLVTWALSAAAEFARRGRVLAFASASLLAGVCS